MKVCPVRVRTLSYTTMICLGSIKNTPHTSVSMPAKPPSLRSKKSNEGTLASMHMLESLLTSLESEFDHLASSREQPTNNEAFEDSFDAVMKSGPQMTGMLGKLSPLRTPASPTSNQPTSEWKHRFFILTRTGNLCVFKPAPQPQHRPIAVLPLERCNAYFDNAFGCWVLQVSGEQRRWTLRPGSKDELGTWIDAIQAVVPGAARVADGASMQEDRLQRADSIGRMARSGSDPALVLPTSRVQAMERALSPLRAEGRMPRAKSPAPVVRGAMPMMRRTASERGDATELGGQSGLGRRPSVVAVSPTLSSSDRGDAGYGGFGRRPSGDQGALYRPAKNTFVNSPPHSPRLR